ncbi:TPA: hypothetical protein ACH3X1_006926 [Trebouxia sp. C0004]
MPKSSSAYYALQVRTADASSIRYLYLKPHTDSSEKVGAALFVAGLGITYDESVLTELFEIFGAVSQVALHQNKTSALVVFASTSSLKKALRTAAENKALTVTFQEPKRTFGLKGWVEQHKAKTPGNRVLQQQLDEWMAQWEAQESQRQSTAATDAADEGWTVVTKQRVSLSCFMQIMCIRQRTFADMQSTVMQVLVSFLTLLVSDISPV